MGSCDKRHHASQGGFPGLVYVCHCAGVGSSANKTLACLWALFQLTSSHVFRNGQSQHREKSCAWYITFRNTAGV